MKIYLLIILFGILNAKSFYANWLSIETLNGKPILRDIRDKKPKNSTFYKVYYKNKTIYKIEKFNKNKIVKIYYFNTKERLKSYKTFNYKKVTNCIINYKFSSKKTIHNVICDDNLTIMTKYENGYIDKIVKIKIYKNNKLIKLKDINNTICTEYNYEQNITNKYNCYPIIESAPINMPKEIDKIEYFK